MDELDPESTENRDEEHEKKDGMATLENSKKEKIIKLVDTDSTEIKSEIENPESNKIEKERDQKEVENLELNRVEMEKEEKSQKEYENQEFGRAEMEKEEKNQKEYENQEFNKVEMEKEEKSQKEYENQESDKIEMEKEEKSQKEYENQEFNKVEMEKEENNQKEQEKEENKHKEPENQEVNKEKVELIQVEVKKKKQTINEKEKTKEIKKEIKNKKEKPLEIKEKIEKMSSTKSKSQASKQEKKDEDKKIVKSKETENKENQAPLTKLEKLIKRFTSLRSEIKELLNNDRKMLQKLQKKKKEMFEHFENQLREISEKFKAFSDIKVEELELPRLLERMNELSKINDKLENVDLDIRKVHPQYATKTMKTLRKKLDYDISRPITGNSDDPTEIDTGLHRLEIKRIIKQNGGKGKTYNLGIQRTDEHVVKLPQMQTLVWMWASENQSYLDFRLHFDYVLDGEQKTAEIIPECNRIWTKFGMLKCFYSGKACFSFSNRLSLMKSKTIMIKWVVLQVRNITLVQPDVGDPIYNSYYHRIHQIHELARKFQKPFPLFISFFKKQNS